MLEIKNLSKSFGNLKAVDKLNLTVEQGELFGFLGPNGAGKTTTIKILTGLLAPTNGNINFNKVDIIKEPIKSKYKLGYIPDQPFLYDKLTGHEFLQFCGGLYNLSNKSLEERIEYVEDLLKIESWIHKKTEDYSQGMKQRVAIASAFLHDPDLIVIDEPMVGLDPQTAQLVKKILSDAAENGKTVFMSTHSLNVVEEICTRVGIINSGKLIFDLDMDSLQNLKKEKNNNFEELFIELTNE
ncbi:MAG: ABC transporter ATP-binding protein [Melioribacteraceae bacterium]|nr:ABC transporter ATP-binding protein [Melioribacteraceae bacterium]